MIMGVILATDNQLNTCGDGVNKDNRHSSDAMLTVRGKTEALVA